MRVQHLRNVLIATASLGLAACGGGSGGSGGGLNVTPPPAPSPGPVCPPTCVQAVIFANAQVGEFATVGASASGPGGAGSFYVGPDPGPSIGSISTAGGDQPHIRYTSDGKYEIQFPGSTYEVLVGSEAKGQVFTTASGAGNILTSASGSKGFDFSELASWSGGGRFGSFAFGEATPAASVPITGSATYSGIVRGTTDVYGYDLLAAQYFRQHVNGSIELDFDFAQGSLAGSMMLALGFSADPLGTFAFKDTVYSVGSSTYSGKFETGVAGQNFFLGQFTGPQAEETIGAWALPFIYSQGKNADHKAHQAFGAWIAKKDPGQ